MHTASKGTRLPILQVDGGHSWEGRDAACIAGGDLDCLCCGEAGEGLRRGQAYAMSMAREAGTGQPMKWGKLGREGAHPPG